MKKFLILLAAALLSFGCQTSPEQANQANLNRNAETPAAEKTAEDFTFEFRTEPSEVKAEEQADLIVTVKNLQGETVKDLQIVHEKPMHMIVVSEDLAEFYHLHPEPQPDGSLKTPFAFPNGGRYKVYADFTPQGAKQMVKMSEFSVTGESRPKEELKPEGKFEKTIGDLLVRMQPGGKFEAGNPVWLDYTVFDSRTKQPVTDLQKYLGEIAHFVVINKELNEFVHVHPLSRTDSKNDHSHDDGAEHKHENGTSDPEVTVSAHVIFPKPGIYKIWAEFQRNGKVTAFPFVVEVGQGKESAPISEVRVPDDSFKVTVNRDGFTPSEIAYRKGKPLKLAFVRTDEENCGSEVVFKDLNITKKLPVNEVVTVEIPTDKEGVITFACGMNMYRGKIIIE